MVAIDPARDALLTDGARSLLKKHYLLNGETPQQGFARASVAWSGGDPALAQRLYDAASKGWFMFASPVLSNAPRPGETGKSLPISCFLSYVGDSIAGLNEHTVETRWLSVLGGGVGGHWSQVRSVSDKAPGPIPFLHTMDADMTAYQQGKVRRGSYAAYMDIGHPDIEEFLVIRQPTGDANRRCLGMGFHHAVNIPDRFMVAVQNDENWHLVDPHDGTTRKTLKARALWERVLELRYRTGEPYLLFIDTANRALPQALKDKGHYIHGSNLCNEIMLPTAPDRTAVCCLSSLNLELYDEWRGTDLVGDLVEMLDNVLEHFIEHAPPALWRAVNAARKERSIGIGYMGWHAHLQRRMIAVESQRALRISAYISKDIARQADARSATLAVTRGEPEDLIGTGHRNAHKIAVAPNANSATIIATSPGIEVAAANAYTARNRVGSHLIRNRYLEDCLTDHGQNTDAVWQSIIFNAGSVAHLDFLDAHEKDVFKTATEIDQSWVIRHAAARQPYIDQGQSVNLFFPANATRAYLHATHMQAWEQGLKGLYYLRTRTSKRADAVGQKLTRDKLMDSSEMAVITPRLPDPLPEPVQLVAIPAMIEVEDCVACQG